MYNALLLNYGSSRVGNKFGAWYCALQMEPRTLELAPLLGIAADHLASDDDYDIANDAVPRPVTSNPGCLLPIAQTFVGFRGHASLLSRARARSAPASHATEAVSVAQLQHVGLVRSPRLQMHSRDAINSLSSGQLACLARHYGLAKICCPDDRMLADATLPFWTGAIDAINSRQRRAFERMTWQELILKVAELARRRLRNINNDSDDKEAAEHLVRRERVFECVSV